jgi:4-amino-4-deoxy-L-arabinose transferase-like glycosyltransferase
MSSHGRDLLVRHAMETPMRQLGRPVVVAWIVIFAIALTLRCGASVYWQNRQADHNTFAFGDSFSYWVLGHQIYEGNEYKFGGDDARISRAPGFPILIAGWHWLFGGKPSVISVRIMNSILGALTVVAVGWLATLLFSQRIGLYTGVLTSIYPGAIAMSVLILSEGPFCLFMTLELVAVYYCFWRANASSTSKRCAAILLGINAAMAVLIRPSWLFYTPALFTAVCLLSKHRLRNLSLVILGALAFALVMLPWWVRNYQVTGRFVPTTLQVGASLYDGLRPGADGASNMSFMQEFYRQQTLEDALAQSKPIDTYEYRLNTRLREASLRWSRENPSEVLRLAGSKFIRMWNVFPNSDAVGSGVTRLATSLGYLGIMLLTFLAVISMIRKKSRPIEGTKQASWRIVALCSSPAVYFTALHMVFVSSIRYRQPAVLILSVLAGAGVAICLPCVPFNRGALRADGGSDG